VSEGRAYKKLQDFGMCVVKDSGVGSMLRLMNGDKPGHRVIGLVNALGIGEEARVSFVFMANPLGIDHELFERGHYFMTSGALSHSHPWHHRTALLAPARL
jgi:hypothetical protein